MYHYRDGSFCDKNHYCGTCPDSKDICCFGERGGDIYTASQFQVISTTQTYSARPTLSANISSGVASSAQASSSGAGSASGGGPQYFYVRLLSQPALALPLGSAFTNRQCSDNVHLLSSDILPRHGPIYNNPRLVHDYSTDTALSLRKQQRRGQSAIYVDGAIGASSGEREHSRRTCFWTLSVVSLVFRRSCSDCRFETYWRTC